MVTAQSACEVACEAVIAQLLTLRGADYLHSCVDQLVGSFNPSGRVRDLYVALSGDAIQQKPFWPAFKECVRLRNQIVHRGATATEQEAAQYLSVAKEVIAHLEARCATTDISVVRAADVPVSAVIPRLPLSDSTAHVS